MKNINQESTCFPFFKNHMIVSFHELFPFNLSYDARSHIVRVHDGNDSRGEIKERSKKH